jgi:hypothetical protein
MKPEDLPISFTRPTPLKALLASTCKVFGTPLKALLEGIDRHACATDIDAA